MAHDLSKKRIIMVHGLASKPPAKRVHELWSHCVIENLRVRDPELAASLEQAPETFASAYWANAVPHHIEDDSRYVGRLRKQVELVVEERRARGEDFHVGTGARFKAFFKDRGLDVVDFLSNALTIKDDVAKAYLREVELYSEDQYIASAIRSPLEAELMRAWGEGCEVALLSHSMGTFISYDVLWRFSHRNEEALNDYARKRVGLFVTMGSPLGDSVIKDLLFARHHAGDHRAHPTNIDAWHNFAAVGDVVSHDKTLDDDYFAPMRELGLLGPKKADAEDHRDLHNPFVVVSHAGNRKRSKRNPHKSYGYLVQPALANLLRGFLRSS
jgi:hypothetical protein